MKNRATQPLPSSGVTLPPHGAFVVQLGSGADAAAGEVFGRVEHVVSGSARRFSSVAELLTFMAAAVAAHREDA